MDFKRYRNFIVLVLLVEGFVALSFQMIFMRKLLMHVGSSVNNISIIIGVILIMMAIGYRYGGNVRKFDVIYKKSGNYSEYLKAVASKVGVNFLLVALISAVAVNDAVVGFIMDYDASFGSLLIYSGLFISPIIFLMAATVPYIVRFFRNYEKEKAASSALYFSTIGSFLGSVVTANFLFAYIGVYATTIFIILLLFFTGVYSLTIKTSELGKKSNRFSGGISLIISMIVMLVFIVSSFVVGKNQEIIADNEFYNYRLVEAEDYKIFQIDKSHSSIIFSSDKNSPYIELMRDVLFNIVGLENQDILVIGAGGFVAGRGLEGSGHKFTYVDVDPKMIDIAEKNFLEGPINGDFVAMDGRAYLKRNERKFDVVFLDAYSDSKSIPKNLSTIEFFNEVRKDIKDDGWFVANIISDVSFSENYSRNIYRTINAVFPFCTVYVKDKFADYSNIIYACKNSINVGEIYIDDKNRSNRDFNSMKLFDK